MKIYKSGYRNHWVSPYSIAEKLCFWREVDYEETWVQRLNTVLEPVCAGWMKLANLVYPQINYVKIDRWDTWSMDHTLADIVLPMLRQLKATKHGSPMVDDEDVPVHLQSAGFKKSKKRKPKNAGNPDIHAVDMDNDDTLHDRWDWVLNEEIWAFEQLVDEHAEDKFFNHTESKGLPWEADYVPPGYDAEGHRAWQARMDNGFRLFGKYYRCHWD